MLTICLKVNIPWNKTEIFKILTLSYSCKSAVLKFLFSDDLSLVIGRLSLISNKNFFYSHEPKCWSYLKNVNNCNEVNDHEHPCYWLV